jgi:MFS family permease
VTRYCPCGTVSKISTPTSATDDPAPQLAPARLALLRHRQFGLLFAGQATSALGDRVVMVAVPFAVLAIPGAGAGDVGVVLGANILSFGLFVLVGGVVADRLPRQTTMLLADLVRCAAQAASAVLLVTGNATVTRLAVLQLLYGAAEAFFRPAVLGLVPQVVEAGQEQAANALLALSANVSMVLGPSLAGVSVAWLGPGGALAIDAGTFVVSAVSLGFLRPRPFLPGPHEGWRPALVGGWHEVAGRSWLWSTLVSFTGYHALVLPALFVLGPQVAESIRDGSTSWGFISAGFGAGAVLGSVLALHWRPRRVGLLIGVTLCLASSQAAIVASSLSTTAVTALELLTGVCVSFGFTLWETALQQHVPAEAHARVSSFDHLVSVTLMPVGYLLVGPVADAIGIRATSLWASALSAVVCLAVALARPQRRLTAVPDGRGGAQALMHPEGA